MSDDREHRIRERAHSLWEEAGKPHGRDQEFWHRAEALIAAEDNPDKPEMTDPPF
jgi:hypothetical protein